MLFGMLLRRESCLLGSYASFIRSPAEMFVLLFGRRPDVPAQLRHRR